MMDTRTNTVDNGHGRGRGVLNGHLPQESSHETRPLQLFKSVVVPINEHKKNLRGETLFVSDCKIEDSKKCAIGVRLPTFCFGFVIGLIVAIIFITFLTYVLHDFGSITFNFAANTNNNKLNESKNSSHLTVFDDNWQQEQLLKNWSLTSAVPTETARNALKTSNNVINEPIMSMYNKDHSENSGGSGISLESVTTSTPIKEVDNTFRLNLTNSFESKANISKASKYNLTTTAAITSLDFDTQKTTMSWLSQLVNISTSPLTTINSLSDNSIQTSNITAMGYLNNDRIQMTTMDETSTESMYTIATAATTIDYEANVLKKTPQNSFNLNDTSNIGDSMATSTLKSDRKHSTMMTLNENQYSTMTTKDNLKDMVTKAYDIKEQTQENMTHNEVIVNKNDDDDKDNDNNNGEDNSVPMSDNKQSVTVEQSKNTSTTSMTTSTGVDRMTAFTALNATEITTNTAAVIPVTEVSVMTANANATATATETETVQKNATNYTLELYKNEITAQTENKVYITQVMNTTGIDYIENGTALIETNAYMANITKAFNDTIALNASINCSEKQFACLSKDKSYICKETKHLCDNIVDCDDGFDEHNCSETCGQNFNCANTTYLQCIPRKFYCDGLWDCENGVDEHRCEIEKCADPNKVICKDRSSCLIPYQICDGNYDCRDHSDELGCIDTTGCEAVGRFMCDNNLCIDYSLRCDGFNDCTDGRDEQNCTCLANEFQCENGDCREKEVKCNGKIDCKDGSDEWSCVRVDQNDVVHLINPSDNRWSILCSNENFTKNDADIFCNQMGFQASIEFAEIAVEIGNETVWAIKEDDKYLYSPNCSTNLAQTLICKTFECSVKVDSEVKAGTSNEIQSLVLLKSSNTSKECLAEIISPIWLLASNECLNFGKEVITVWINHTIMIGEVDEVINHPHSSKFRSLLMRDFDLSIIKLKEAINFHTTHSNAVCLPENEVEFEITCFVNKFDETDPVPFTLLDIGVCNEQYHYNASLTKRHLCANNQRKASEEIAIGSPLMCLSSESKWFLAGLLSYSNRRKSFKKHPSIFSNIFAMKKFIKLVTGSQEYNATYDDSLYRILSETELILLKNLTEIERMRTMNRLEFMSSPLFLEADNNTDNTTDVSKMFDYVRTTQSTTMTDVVQTTAIDGSRLRMQQNSTTLAVTELPLQQSTFTATMIAFNDSSSRNV